MGCGGSTAAGGGGGSGGKAVVDLKGKGTESLASIKPNTQELDVSDNGSLTSLDGVGALTALEKLDASSCQLTTVPAEIEKCASLEELLLFANKIKEVPAALASIEGLTTLNLFNNQLKKLPPEIGKLSKLEEVNCAANKMMMLTDAHFTSWGTVKILSLYDNNLVRMGSLASLVALEELRISGNNLEEMPTLSERHASLTVYEIHKNRIASIPETYFSSTPALQRLSLWKNMLTSLPSSLAACPKLVGLQAQENQLASLPSGAWPATLETLFLQDNPPLAAIPEALSSCKSLKRVNLSNLKLDGASQSVAGTLKSQCLADKDGIFWGTDGMKLSP